MKIASRIDKLHPTKVPCRSGSAATRFAPTQEVAAEPLLQRHSNNSLRNSPHETYHQIFASDNRNYLVGSRCLDRHHSHAALSIRATVERQTHERRQHARAPAEAYHDDRE